MADMVKRNLTVLTVLSTEDVSIISLSELSEIFRRLHLYVCTGKDTVLVRPTIDSQSTIARNVRRARSTGVDSRVSRTYSLTAFPLTYRFQLTLLSSSTLPLTFPNHGVTLFQKISSGNVGGSRLMTSFKRGAAVLDVAVVLAVEGVTGGGTVAMAVCMALSYSESVLWAVVEVSIRVCSSCISPLTRSRSILRETSGGSAEDKSGSN
jgi:hypothetical protein